MGWQYLSLTGVLELYEIKEYMSLQRLPTSEVRVKVNIEEYEE